MNIIVTGASSGLGKELAKKYAELGHKVIAIARSEAKLKTLSDSFKNIIPIAYDLKKVVAFDRLRNQIQEEIEHIDILINNAGILINKSFRETDINEIKNTFDTNFTAAACLIQTLFPIFNKNKAHIINIGSMGGYQGSVKFPGLSFYSASKGALAILTECLAEEYKDTHIHFNCLALGSVNTEMLKNAFPGLEIEGNSPQEMAKYIADFSINGYPLFNGKIIPVSHQTP